MKSRVLIYDIETSPLITYTWGTYQQNAIEVLYDYQVLTVSWKWLGEDKVHSIGQDDMPKYSPGKLDDFYVIAQLWKLFDEADVVIAHNGDRFDQKKARGRMLLNDFLPPAPFKTIDTLKVARKYFALTSNRLGELGKALGLGDKLETGGFELWRGCMEGAQDAWDKMKLYNEQDVALLERVYLKLRPWIENHPPINILEGEIEACPKCGHTSLQKRGVKVNKTSTVQRYRCNGCGGWSQSRSTDRHDNLYVN